MAEKSVKYEVVVSPLFIKYEVVVSPSIYVL